MVICGLNMSNILAVRRHQPQTLERALTDG